MVVVEIKQISNMERISLIVIGHGNTLRTWNIPEAVVIDIELGLEEVLANIVRQGYKSREIDITEEIEINLTKYDSYLELMICDKGIFFDINSHNEVEMDSYLNSQINGGFGACLVKKIMTEIRCLKQNDTNITILRKSI